MDADFWHDLWARNHIPFHRRDANALLVAHADLLPPGGRVFLPLCGKTRDIAWLLARGHRVAGIELSRLAVEQLFAELGVVPDITILGPLVRFAAPAAEVYVGDIFALTGAMLGPVDATYDRAALIALPPDLRPRYAAHVSAITGTAPQLLIGLEFDGSPADGPPFSVDAAEMARLYGGHHVVTHLLRTPMREGPVGLSNPVDTVWHLH